MDKLPDRRIALRAAQPSGKIDGFLGLLAGKRRKKPSLTELKEAAAAGWAGKSEDYAEKSRTAKGAKVYREGAK